MDVFKVAGDRGARLLQHVEHQLRASAGDVVLEGFERSIQLDAYSCGAQAAFSILSFFGKARSLKNTTKKIGTDEDGTSWGPIRDLFRARGLVTKATTGATKKDLLRAVDNEAPVLVLLDDRSHFATVYGYGRGRIYLADPSLLRSASTIVRWSAFRSRWDGWAAAVSSRRTRSSSWRK